MDLKLQLLEAITNNFSEDQKVGSGAYGDVYKGVLDGKEIAVKKLHPLQGLDDERFENEFRNLSSIHHENVVSLIGYCYEIRHKHMQYHGQLIFAKIVERIMCFEYMHGGSLDKHIADESCQLDWPTCYRIIKGTCDGLNHLHTMLIYHLDLKPSNILLDNTMKPKISDLGLSRLVSSTKSYETERIMGTAGYMPPEYIDGGLISNKFDVFSLGITIIKILAGNVGYLRCYEMSPKDFIEFVSFHWMKRSQAMPDILRVITCVEIALRCVELDREKRPHIENIVNELEEVEVEINKIMLLPPDRWQILLTNQGPDLGFPKISRLCIAHNLVQSISIHLIEAITNNFSDDHKIGSDWYGDVYRAVYNGEEIAVKKLHSLQVLDDRDFENDMHSLTKVRHKNVGRLVGYFYEPRYMKIKNNEEPVRTRTMEPILCFEYMQGRSLDKYIADEPCGLDWPILYKIIKGTCKGLNHLLSAQERPILHLNLTPANIFLVKSKTPKIIGFGLWRLIDSTKMHQTKNFKETPGYMPPEYVDIGFISNKFDVFSLGVIIIKMMAGNMGYSRCFEMSPKEFIDLVCEHWTKRLHATPEYSSYELDILRMSTCVEIALTCADADREKRPCIEDIVHKLGELETRIKTIMLLPHDHRQTLLTNLCPEPYFPRNSELYMSNNLAKDGNVTVYKSKWSRHDSLPGPSRQVVSTPHHMSLQHLRDITNNFSDERILGTGGSYAVYKGILQSGRMIAVKKLVKLTLSSQAEFEKEINLLIKLKHPNIVRLVGYCYETQYIRMHHKGGYVFAEDIQTLLCLEYLPNGSLDKHISEMSSYAWLDATIDKKHRAALMQAGKKLDLLVTRTPQTNWMIHPEWVDRLMWAGLLPLARLVEGTLDEWVDHPELDEAGEPMQLHRRQMKRFSYDRSLLTCLVDRWRPETHTFHFPWGEMAPTLQDVSYLLGLPLAGAAIGPLQAEPGWAATLQARFLAAVPTAVALNNDPHGPHFQWLSQFQIVSLGYPGVQLTEAQVDRSLEAYLLWLFGKTMFTENHVTTVDARLISIAREIADARCPGDIMQRSFGSAVLAATYRGLCKGCMLSSQRSGLVGCPLLLQLWSYERFPIGRPYVCVDKPFGLVDMAGAYVQHIGDLPTVGSVWARRERQFAGMQVKSCYPSFTSQFDGLHEDVVIWEPYSHQAITSRYPAGISALCTRDQHYWMTKARLVFDVTVEEMALHRVMRQFGRCQDEEIPVIPHIPAHVHKFSRVGGNKSMDFWLRNIGPYVLEWTTAPTHIWEEVRPFDWDRFALYLQRYRQSTRIYLVPRAAPDQIEEPLPSDMYPTSSIMGTRHHASDLAVEAREEVSALMRRVERGDTIPQPEHLSWLKRFDEKLRGIYSAVTCRRSSDVAVPRPAQRPPRPSVHRSGSRRMASPAPPPSQPGRSSWHAPPPSYPGSSAWQDPPPSHPGRSSWQEPSPSHAGSSAWQESSPSHAGGSSWQEPHPSHPGSSAWQEPHPSQSGWSAWHETYPSQPGGSSWHQQMGPVSNQPHPFTHVVDSPMLAGDGSLFADDDDEDANMFAFDNRTVHDTPPPPPPTQETQTMTGEVMYGRGLREPRPPRQRLSLSGPRQRKVQTRLRPPQ